MTNNWDEIINSPSDKKKKITDWEKELDVPTENKKQSLADIIKGAGTEAMAQGSDLLNALSPLILQQPEAPKSKLITETIPSLVENIKQGAGNLLQKSATPLPIPPLTQRNIQSVLSGKGITETTNGVQGDLSAIDLALMATVGGAQISKNLATNKILQGQLGPTLAQGLAEQEAAKTVARQAASIEVPGQVVQEPLLLGNRGESLIPKIAAKGIVEGAKVISKAGEPLVGQPMIPASAAISNLSQSTKKGIEVVTASSEENDPASKKSIAQKMTVKYDYNRQVLIDNNGNEKPLPISEYENLKKSTIKLSKQKGYDLNISNQSTKEQTPAEAKKLFDANWKKNYGDRPATINEPSALQLRNQAKLSTPTGEVNIVDRKSTIQDLSNTIRNKYKENLPGVSDAVIEKNTVKMLQGLGGDNKSLASSLHKENKATVRIFEELTGYKLGKDITRQEIADNPGTIIEDLVKPKLAGAGQQPPATPPPTAVAGGPLPEPKKDPIPLQSYINLAKYPKDVQESIKKIIDSQPIGLQRKVVSHKEIQEMAQTINDTPIIRQMLKMPEGQLAAEWLKMKQGEVSLVREALKSDMDEFKQKMLDVLKIKQLSMAGKTGTEIGRALGSGNIDVHEQLGLAGQINDKIAQVKKDITLSDEQKKAFIENLVSARKQFLSKDFNPTWFDKGYEFWVNNILSGPWTHTVNVVSNTMFAGIKPLEKAVYAAVDLPMSWWTGKKTHNLAEVVAQAKGFGKAFGKDKLPLAIAEGSKIENYNHPGTIKGLKGKIIRGEAWLKLPNGKMIPTNLGTAQLRTEDNYSKKLIGWMELCGKAEMIARSEGLTGNALIQRKNELLFNPTKQMKDQVLQEQLYRTFQDATFLGEWAKKLPQFGLRWVLPFRNTPASILTKAFERTPFGFGKVGLKFGRQFVGKKIPYKQGEASADIGNAIIGTSIFFGLLYAYKMGRVTGSAPKKGPARDKFFAEGKQPNSMLVGGKWIPYDRLEPYGTAAQYMVNTIQMFDKSEKETTFDKVLESMYGLSTSAADKTFLSGMTSAVEAVVDPQRYGEQFSAKLVGGFVPQAGLLRNVTQATDLRVREPANLGERLTTNLPGASQLVTQKRNAFGEKQFRNPEGITKFLPYQITQVKESTELQKELSRLDINLERIPKSYRTLKLSPKEINTVAKVEGGLIKEQLTNLIANPDYQGLTDINKQKQIDRVINNTKHEVRGVFLQDKIIGDLKKQLKGKSPEVQANIKERYFDKLEKAKLIPKKVEETPVAPTVNNWEEILK